MSYLLVMQDVRSEKKSSWSWWAALPPLYAAFIFVGLWLVYAMAIADKRIVPLGSAYSFAGNFPPASCVFGQVLNLSGFGGVVLFFCRYVQVKPKLTEAWLNVTALVAMCFSCFGLTIVGNFQATTAPTIHNIGAVLVFVVGTLACWLQTWITIKINIKDKGMKTVIIRVFLSVVMTICLVLGLVYAAQGHDMPAAQSEWALAVIITIFHSTFVIDFRCSGFETVCTDIRLPTELAQAGIVSTSQAQQ